MRKTVTVLLLFALIFAVAGCIAEGGKVTESEKIEDTGKSANTEESENTNNETDTKAADTGASAPGEWTLLTSPTLTGEGAAIKVTAGGTVTVKLPVLNDSDYTSYITGQPSCTQEGVKKYVYAKDGAVFTFETVLPKTDHSPVAEAEIAATCTQEGKTGGAHCSVCGTVLSYPTTVPALGHSYGADGKCIRCGQSENEYIQITDIEGLKNISKNMSGKYLLAADIDMTDMSWIPIGTETVQFTGEFNGGGHTVTFGRITATSENALFYTNSGTVYGLTVKASGAVIKNAGYKGGYIAVINNGTIRECEITGVRVYEFYAEAEGADRNKTGVVKDETYDFSFGEFCAINSGKITGCKNSGSVAVIHTVKAAHYGYGYGVPLVTMTPYIVLESSDHTYVHSSVKFGGVCADNRSVIENCRLEATYNCEERAATDTHRSEWWYGYARAWTEMSVGSVTAVNGGTVSDTCARKATLSDGSYTVSTNADHESISFEFRTQYEYIGLIAANEGSVSDLTYVQ